VTRFLSGIGWRLRGEMSKTIERPGRLLTAPLLRLVLRMVRVSWLVPWVRPLWSNLWSRTEFGRVFCSAVGHDLFQTDQPAQAWQWLKLLFDSGRPSIDENLLGANCLYQGLGRLGDAITLLGRANEQDWDEAQRLGLANLPYRVVDSVWARHFGHLALIDYAIKLGILEGRSREDTILYLPPGSPIANPFLLQEIARELWLVKNSADLPFSAAAVQPLHYDLFAPRLPDHTTRHYWQVAGETYARWHLEHRSPLFSLAAHVDALGRQVLQSIGVPNEAWFVALHVREGRWAGDNAGMNAVRNSDISSYFPAIREVTNRGGWVVRMGDPGMRPLPKMANVIDYCHSVVRADWMDVYLLSRCRFLIGTNSGPAFVPAIYGVPSVLTNWWPIAERPWQPFDIFIPKMLRRLSDGHYLTMSEMLKEPLCYSYSPRQLAYNGVRIEDNEACIIRSAVVEMLQRLDGKANDDREVDELRLHVDRLYRSRGLARARPLWGNKRACCCRLLDFFARAVRLAERIVSC
jgi:putative glycosyltransferase (TIGR04372 family)